MINTFCGIALSLHLGLGEDYKYNELHPYCKAETENNVVTGVYYNSVKKLSVFVGYEYHINDNASIEIGLATGYQYTVVPTTRVNYKDIFLMPALDDGKSGIVLGIEFKF